MSKEIAKEEFPPLSFSMDPQSTGKGVFLYMATNKGVDSNS